MPFSQLLLYQFLSLIHWFKIRRACQCVLVVQQQNIRKRSPEAILAGAAHVLSDWPNHFFELLSGLGRNNSSQSTDIRAQFAPLYSSLFKRKLGTHPEDIDFLRVAFLDFVCNQWDQRSVDPKTLRRVSHRVSRRFVTRAELARSLHVDPRTLKRHRELDQMTDRIQPNARTVIDLHEFGLISSCNSEVLRMRQAAHEIGLPVEVLRGLRACGAFEVKHQPLRKPGFHKMDVQSFLKQFVSHVSDPSAPVFNGPVITISRALRLNCRTVDQRMALIRSIIVRDIRIAGSATAPIGKLTIATKDMETFLKTTD